MSGRIDGANVAEFEESVRAAITDSDHTVIMDLERLSYISSSGLRILLLIVRNLMGQDARFALCAMSDQMRKVSETGGFDKIIPIHLSRAEALSSHGS